MKITAYKKESKLLENKIKEYRNKLNEQNIESYFDREHTLKDEIFNFEIIDYWKRTLGIAIFATKLVLKNKSTNLITNSTPSYFRITFRGTRNNKHYGACTSISEFFAEDESKIDEIITSFKEERKKVLTKRNEIEILKYKARHNQL